MPIHTGELLKAAEMVAESRQMKVSLKYSLMGAGIASLTTFIGGVTAGPIGLLLGATGGGIASYKLSKDKFKPLVTVLREDLTQAQKLQLANHLTLAIKDFDITDVAMLMAAISSNDALIKIFMNTIKQFIEGEIRLPVTF